MSGDRNSDGYLVAAPVQTDMLNFCPQNAGQTKMKASYEILRKYGRFEMKKNFIHQYMNSSCRPAIARYSSAQNLCLPLCDMKDLKTKMWRTKI